MKSGFMRIASAVVLAVGGLALPSPALAQTDCGTKCATCGLSGWEGTTHSTSGDYNMTCHSFVPYCVACPATRASDGEDAEAILLILKSGSDDEVRSLMRRHRDRFLISHSRKMVVLRGTKCDPKAFAAVAYLDGRRANLLQQMRLASLDSRVDHARDIGN